MRKNKGIIIELTALLDVIFIMLFWVMINVQQSSVKVKNDADSRVAEAEQMIEDIRAEADSRVERAEQQLEKTDRYAAANQQALNDFGEGMMITLNLRYEPGGKLTILDGDGELAETDVTPGNDIYTVLVSALGKADIERDDVVLCAFVYDGSKALYRDVSEVSDAVGKLGKSYENFYCTYINTAR